MPRNISFALTTKQIRNQTKTVTRRLGWKFLTPGTVLNACVKCMGLKPGEKIEKICQIRVTNADQEPLRRMIRQSAYGQRECEREGFPEMKPEGFVDMFCREMGCSIDEDVTRIEFEYLDAESKNSEEK